MAADAPTLHRHMLKRLFVAVLGITALCTFAPVDAVPEKVHVVFSNHLVSHLPADSSANAADIEVWSSTVAASQGLFL